MSSSAHLGVALGAAALTAATILAAQFMLRRRTKSTTRVEYIGGPPRPVNPRQSLTGKVIVITGAAQGLGLSVAQLAVAAGARAVVLIDRNIKKGTRAASDLGEDRCCFIACDVQKPEQIAAAVAEVDAKYGAIDYLVNAAGDTSRAELDETSVELFDKLVAVNLRAPFLFTQHAARLMARERKGGAIVNVASVQANGGLTFCCAYATTKGGLLTMTRNTAAALGRHGVKVNAINMGWCCTDQEHALQHSLGQSSDWVEAADSISYLGRICRPEDVARAILWLCTDAHTTGSVLELHPEYIPGMLGGGIGKTE